MPLTSTSNTSNFQEIIDVRGNVSTQLTEYTAPNVRTTYADIPTSDVTAVSVTVDGFTTSATDNTDVTTSATRAWTATGIVLTATDGRGNTTTTRTDLAGRAISVTDAAGFATTTAYCADSDRPSIITNARGKTSCYRYDLRKRKVAEWGTAMQPALFEYDEADRLVSLKTFRAGTEIISSDPAGRSDGDTTRWEYDPATGLERVKTYADNTQVLTTYDAMNRVASVTNARGIVQSRAYATATGLLTGITFSDTTTPQRFVYDALGRPTARDTKRQGAEENDTFAYNNRSELVNAVVSGTTHAYDYDNIGNRRMTIEGNEYSLYESNELNQYAAIQEGSSTTEPSTFTPTFDADGNQTRIKTATGIWEAVYNALNRPVSYTRENEDSTRSVITADYDYMGRRVFKKVETVTTDSESGEETRSVLTHHRFLYRGYLQITALDLTSEAPLNDLWLITWDPTAPIATRPLAIQKDGTWYTYGWDLTKNICEIYGTDGTIKNAYTYTPYGQVTASGSVIQCLQWSSEYSDTELALVYYNYRHYNPLDGRWCGRDRIAEEEGYNLYAYLSNKVTHLIDEKGMKSIGLGSLFELISNLISAIAGYEMGDCIKKYPPKTKQSESSCMSCVNTWAGIAAASGTASYAVAMAMCTASTAGWGLFSACLH